MTGKKIGKRDKIAGALGASRVVRLKGRRPRNPLGWLEMAQALQSRLISQGGRPSDPHWDTKRLVPFRKQTWKHLTEEAKGISAQGRKVGPAQLAAIMIEEGLVSTAAVVSEKQARVRLKKSDWDIRQSFDTSSTEPKILTPLIFSATPVYHHTIIESSAKSPWSTDRAPGDLMRSASIGV